MWLGCWLALGPIFGQELARISGVVAPQPSDQSPPPPDSISPPLSSGVSTETLIQQALTANGELAAARLDIERARGRLRQAGLRPNPTVEAERTAGILNSPGERNVSFGLNLPLELNGQRQRRVELARLELAAAEAEVADRERRLTADVRTAAAEVLASQREFDLLTEIIALDAQSLKTAEDRVSVGDAAPLDANLLRVEADRFRSRRMLVEGRLKAAYRQLKTLTGLPYDHPLTLSDRLGSAFSALPVSLEAALDVALRSRPDLRLARLNEEAAAAGLRLVQAQARPDVTAFTRYATNESSIDSSPVGFLTDRDKLLTFGVSVSLPLFNRNQGAKAEAVATITQTQHRREFLEQVVRAEIAALYDRMRAAQDALSLYKSGVLDRSQENLRAIRGSYEAGAFRVSEVVAEQRRFADAQREYTETLAELYRAQAALLAAVGASVPKETQP